jgi:hypothetical protein
MQPWLQVNHAHIHIEKQCRCASELPPDTATHQLALLEQLTIWVSPWGELINSSTKTV